MLKDKRIIKFRYWNTINKIMVLNPQMPYKEGWTIEQLFSERGWVWLQFTGLRDKKGKEIYELHEINKKYRVVFNQESATYVLQDISNNDIIPLYALEKKELEITGEYCPIP